MLRALAGLVHRRPVRFLVAAVAVAGLAAVFGLGVASRLDPYGAEDPASESARADVRLESASDRAAGAGVIALVETDGNQVASPPLDRRARERGSRAQRLGGEARDLARQAKRRGEAAEQAGGRATELGAQVAQGPSAQLAARAQRAQRRAESLGARAKTAERRALGAGRRARGAKDRAERALDRAKDARSPAARERVKRVRRAIEAEPSVKRVDSYYKTPDSAFVSKDREATFLAISFRPEGDKEQQAAAERIAERLIGPPGVTLGGPALANQQVNEQVSHDLERAELLALPLLFLLSLIFFRGLVAAALPPLVGGLSIVLTFAGLRVASELTSVSIFALNLVTGLGLGLAIDYSLFIVSRYREELARVGPGAEAIRNTLSTAGRTVLFSALTVASALASLLVFPQRFLYSMGLGGVIVSLIAVGVALLVLPAILVLLGPRVNALSPKRLRGAAERDARPATQGFWYRLSRFVMRRPGRIALISTLAIVALGLPFLGIRFIVADAEVLPAEASARQVSDQLAERFDEHSTEPVRLVVAAKPGRQVHRFVRDVRDVEGVKSVAPPDREGPDTTLVTVTSRYDALSDRGQQVVRRLRTLETPFPVLVGGFSASFVDLKSSLVDHLPLAFAIVVAGTMLLLFLMTGSVVLPVKALVMNVLSLSATFGILVLIFQDGRLEGLLGYESQGALEATQPILLFALAFGLSTDYGVFLLSRIKEARDSGESDSESVAIGLERTGRIVTAAALLFAVAIGAFATSQIIFIKEVGLGTALAVLIDATVIRALLVPSLMELLGRRNWWAPRPLRWLHGRLGVSETGTPRAEPRHG